MNISKTRTSRQGVTAVEFAIVAPLLLGFMFVIIEISRMTTFQGSVNTALLSGMRELSLPRASADGVEDLIRVELGRLGITEANITFNPSSFDRTNQEVELSIEVPANRANGLTLSHLSFGGENSVRRVIAVDRETR